MIDADVLALSQYDHLFSLPAPAGVLNERKKHLLESDEKGEYEVTEKMLASGEWGWHLRYKMCPHGSRVPRSITDRVACDPTNMGVNGSLFVLEPSMEEFDAVVKDVEMPEIQRLVGDLFEWPDMQYLTMRWSGRWTNIDARFSGMNGYPHPSVLFGTHFAGFKPWYFNRAKTMARYARHADFQLWFETYLRMVEDYPSLLELGKLRRLRDNIAELFT